MLITDNNISDSIGGTITRVGDMATEAQHTSNDRLKGALALKAWYDAYKLITGGQPAQSTDQSLETNPQKGGGRFGVSGGMMVAGSVSYGLQTIDHNYQSATGQSDIVAGNGGFDLRVKGNTHLEGAAITSTAAPDKNILQTASLTSRDLVNTEHTESESISVSISTESVAKNVMQNALSNLNAGAGLPEDSDQRGNTVSVISPSNVVITGTGDATKDAQSKAVADTLTSRDASTANEALTNTLTLQQAQNLQAAQQEVQENLRAANLAGAVMTNVVSYTLIDRNTNQPTMIMEPLDYEAYRNTSPGNQALMNLSPQYALDFASSGLYASAGENRRAAEHLIAGVTSGDYARDVALGIAGAAIASGAIKPGGVIADKGATALDDIATNIHSGQQGKHIPGNNNFIPGRSTMNTGINPQELLNGAHSGQYPVVGTGSRGQPIVDFGRVIGTDASSGMPTQYGTIHSGTNGAHIVPTNPTIIGAKR